jgi:hypothetical protein
VPCKEFLSGVGEEGRHPPQLVEFSAAYDALYIRNFSAFKLIFIIDKFIIDNCREVLENNKNFHGYLRELQL